MVCLMCKNRYHHQDTRVHHATIVTVAWMQLEITHHVDGRLKYMSIQMYLLHVLVITIAQILFDVDKNKII